MTAAEVIDQIKSLPPQEKAKVIDFVQGLETAPPLVRTLERKAFEQAARNVFERHSELMRKLSQ